MNYFALGVSFFVTGCLLSLGYLYFIGKNKLLYLTYMLLFNMCFIGMDICFSIPKFSYSSLFGLLNIYCFFQTVYLINKEWDN